MQRKALQVQVELDIHAVTCPGVFLCPNGKVSVQLYMLDSCIQTVCTAPVFPILCHEKFIFYKMFYEAQRLSDLQRLLNKECLYIELIQWQNSEVGNVLATFQTNLNELLYPSTVESAIAGIDIDLLMEPERSFPGVIAPKIEVSTKTIIEDTVLDSSSSSVVNPKVIPSKICHNRANSVHLKRVCHSTGYHRSKRCFTKGRKNIRPPFIVRKVDEGLLARKPTGLTSVSKEKCTCCTPKLQNNLRFNNNHNRVEKLPIIKQNGWNKPRKTSRSCLCNGEHEEFCPVCSKYKHYFESNTYPSPGNRKFCVLQTDVAQPRKNCTCEEINSGKNSKVIRCTSAMEKEKRKECFCSPTMSTLAMKLHRRLNQTLECGNSTDLFSLPQSPYSPPGSDISCECPELRVADFYKDLYRRTKSKINSDRYMTPCCI